MMASVVLFGGFHQEALWQRYSIWMQFCRVLFRFSIGATATGMDSSFSTISKHPSAVRFVRT